MKNTGFKEFVSSAFAGFSISLGCMIYMILTNKVLGALFFTVGLFMVLTRNYNLYTGKVALLTDNIKYIFNLVNIWLGNLFGAAVMTIFTKYSKLHYLVADAQVIVDAKLSQGYLSSFILAILCGIIIYLAVDTYKRLQDCGKYIGLFVFIPLFIICGFEHCVANMYYILMAGELSIEVVIFTIVVTVGNAVGSIVYKLFEKIYQRWV